ncbi:MAG TPA: acyltransferase family protein [Terracidiphilus sp.]|nr:acyltransferase family protein [Terracidiphilus sp.]
MLHRDREIVSSIQALRAIAVVFVVLNHFFPAHLPGGYIGVDVFFVVSGFLISSHLLRELKGGSLNFSRFYLRRARRLLPASLLVLGLTCLAISLSMPSAWQVTNLKDAAAAAIYGVNWRFAANAVDYFAESNVSSPVNHYWSLSVEEQFYLVWPALMFFSLRLAIARTRRTAESLIPVVIGVLIVTIALFSLVSAILAVHRNPTSAYFLTYARAWEFAAGGLAGLMLTNLKNRLQAGWIKPLFAVAWLALIASGWFLRPESGVPGLFAAPAVLAASIVLVIGDDHGSPLASRIIGFPPVQWIGDISYSLYLWHWPLLILAPLALGVIKLGVAGRIVLLGFSFALSDITKRHVEDRFRFVSPIQKDATRSLRNSHALVTYLSLSACLATFAFLGARFLEGESIKAGERLYRLSMDPDPCFGARATEPGANCPNSHLLADRVFAMQSRKTQINEFPNGPSVVRFRDFVDCQNVLGDSALAPCEFGAAEKATKERIAIFGDSHAGMWEQALATFVAPRGIRVRSYLASSCAITTDDRSLDSYLLPEYRDACRAWRRAATAAIIADKQIGTVVISDNAYKQKILNETGNWSEDDGRGVAEVLERFRTAGKRVVVIDDVPNLPFALPDCLARARTDNDPCTFDESELSASTPLGRAVALMPAGEVDYLNFKDVFCDGALCHSVIGGIPAYIDTNHITAPFARSLANRIEKSISKNEPAEPHRSPTVSTQSGQIRSSPHSTSDRYHSSRLTAQLHHTLT